MRTAARGAFVLVCLLGVVAFALSTMTANSTPTPRPFQGWAAALTSGPSSASQLDLSLVAFDPGGYGKHPRVQYAVEACGKRPIHGVLLLGGQARLRDLQVLILPNVGPDGGPGLSPRITVALARHLPFQHPFTDIRGNLGPVQVIRLILPASRCGLSFARAADESRFVGSFVGLQGRLEGAPHRASFAPFGLWPVRQTQSWPLLGSVPGSNQSLREFRFGRVLPGSWARPRRSHFRLNVGGLDAKANVDFSRPAVTNATDLAWTSTTPFAAAARLTNADNQARWQTLVLAATIWFGIGGSVVAALAFELVRPRRDRFLPGAALASEPLPPATAPELFAAFLLTLVRGWRRKRQ